MKTVVVLGGGITGLCTMHYLQRQVKEHNLDVRLVLIEKNTYLGGKLYSAHEQGFIMETGADSIVARHQGVMELVQELDFEFTTKQVFLIFIRIMSYMLFRQIQLSEYR